MKKYTFADYLFQFITITAGVLIALLIGGLAEWNNNRELVATAREMIALEVADNLKELADLPQSVASSNADVDTGMTLADDLLTSGKTGINSMKLNFDLATLSVASWQTAERTGALALMSYDEVRRYSELYDLQQLFDTQQRKAIDLVANSSSLLSQSFDPATASKQDVGRFREQLMLLRANLIVTEQLGRQLVDAYRKVQSER